MEHFCCFDSYSWRGFQVLPEERILGGHHVEFVVPLIHLPGGKTFQRRLVTFINLTRRIRPASSSLFTRGIVFLIEQIQLLELEVGYVGIIPSLVLDQDGDNYHFKIEILRPPVLPHTS